MLNKIPDTIVLAFYLVLCACALSWVVPNCEAQTYEVFSAFYKGFVDKADIIAFVLIVGGSFFVLNSTSAVDKAITAFVGFLRKKQSKSRVSADDIVFSLITIVFSLFGAVFGMSEETIAFVLIFVPMSISMGYDSILGVAISYLAAHIGFAAAFLNPFTIGVAQSIAEVQLFTGVEYRFLCWLILTTIAVFIILKYAHKIKKNPKVSPMYTLDEYWRKRKSEQTEIDRKAKETIDDISLRKRQKTASFIIFIALFVIQAVEAYLKPMSTIEIAQNQINIPILPILATVFAVLGFYSLKRSNIAFIFALFVYTILYLVFGVLCFSWYITEISALFFAMALVCGLSKAYTMNSLMKKFVEGIKDMLSPALVIAMASGMIFILQDSKLIDLMLSGAAKLIGGLDTTASLFAMYIFETSLNLIMPSGTAKAALTMPFLAPLSDILNISRQTTVSAFCFGDGFTNVITPVSGVMLGALAAAKIPYKIWLRWVYKIVLFFIFLGFILLLPSLYWQINGF